jgi:hypothetical protein
VIPSPTTTYFGDERLTTNRKFARLFVNQTSAVESSGGYTSWAAIAGFFDGDGSVDVDPREYTLHWVISISDNWLGQIEQVRKFLLQHGIKVGKPGRVGVGAWMCEVAEISSLIALATSMLASGGTYKKRRELQLLLDYYSDKITGTEVVEAFNEEVRLGRRIGKTKHLDMPYTHSGGFTRGRYASRYEQGVLNSGKSMRLVEDYERGGTTCRKLAQKCDMSVSTVSRILRRAGVECRPRMHFRS